MGGVVKRVVKKVIKNGHVVTSDGVLEAEIEIENGFITNIASRISIDVDIDAANGIQEIDATGCYVIPGLVDLHTHLREPGREDAETVETGSRAAALGGYTAVVAMPNTEPAIDNVGVVRQVQEAAKNALCDVVVAGSITVGRAGEQLSPMAEMNAIGVNIFTDDGSGLQSNGLMRRALEYALSLDATIASHCEDNSLSFGGHMHEGAVSSRLGIPGIPPEAEELMVMREIALMRKTGGHMHLMHISTKGSVVLVREAKARGIPITAEAMPHHFTLTDEEVASFDPVFKVNPPLRSREDVDAVKRGLSDGTIDAIATDHAPHVQELKDLPFDEAPCGMLNLQTAFSLAVTELTDLSIENIVKLMSTTPARIAKLDATHGEIAVGRPANIAIVDIDSPDATWVVDPNQLASKSRNTPYSGRKLRGVVRHTLLHGDHVVIDGKAQR